MAGERVFHTGYSNRNFFEIRERDNKLRISICKVSEPGICSCKTILRNHLVYIQFTIQFTLSDK